ncbi:hypothetical protein ACOJR9_17615 [Alteromonas sp. A081]|uniref:hypothetical protein n=1 Tax=Alteromonas sp. A081 TaxID=3410269 RepID=UPI003B98508D
MKTWLLVLLVAFSVIAGFKVVSYQQKLDHSKVEHERLSDVLARSRSTQTSELKIVKPITKVKEERETADVSAAERDLRQFFDTSPYARLFSLENIACTQVACEIVGVFIGTIDELNDVVKGFPNRSWWTFGAMESSYDALLSEEVKFTATFMPREQKQVDNVVS